MTCPVVAIHGDGDPHSAEGIQEPLAANVKDFRMVMLEKCGHHLWCERHALETFYELLAHEGNSRIWGTIQKRDASREANTTTVSGNALFVPLI